MPLNTSKNSKTSPKVSIVIPTLNSQRVLTTCLDSIVSQNFKNYKIIICDGGSTDNTLQICKNYHCKIVKNKLKTAEAGKAIGLKNATGKYVAFIDSDNILPSPQWLTQMVYPLEIDNTIIGSEPWDFTYRQDAGYIERYSSLIGANDPYAYVTGIYDRRNQINSKWTAINLIQKNYNNFIKAKLEYSKKIPTIGANGTVFRTDFLKHNFDQKYLFDIDVITQILNKTKKPLFFAKTKNGIIHTYCESSITKFYKKQNRRLKDYFEFKKYRNYDYNNDFNSSKLNNLTILVRNNLKFVLYTVLIVPSLITTIRGFIKKPDIAWFFHPIACLISLYCYVSISIANIIGISTTQSRQTWSQ